MMRRACFALRVIEAPQSAAAQPASASLWDLLLCWLARRGPAGGGIIGMYGGVRGGRTRRACFPLRRSAI